jgi:hypothetical protein
VKLEEYWEVDGRMLCERHAKASDDVDDDASAEDWVQSSKAMKRVTRFISFLLLLFVDTLNCPGLYVNISPSFYPNKCGQY